MTRVLLTGGSSPLGDVLVPQLVCSHNVVATARSDAAAARLAQYGVEVVRYDLQSSCPPPLPPAAAVVHLAGIGLAEPLVRLVEAVRPSLTVVVSSASATVRGHPRREAVLAGEGLLRAAADGVVVLRPTMIYGSWRDRNVRKLWERMRRLPFVPRVRGGGWFQPVLADDVCAAVLDVLSQPRRGVLPVAGPEPVRLDDVLDGLAQALGRRRLGPAVPLDLVAALLRRAPATGSRTRHAVEMLQIDRSMPSPGAVGLSYAPTPLVDGLRLAVRRYAQERGRASVGTPSSRDITDAQAAYE